MTAELDINWAQGYSGKDAAFIDSDTICQRCGHMIKFTSFNGNSTVFNPETENIGFLAVHPVNKVFAVAESDILEPKILIFEYPTMTLVNTITGGAEIDYTSVVFSYSDFLCTTSGVPDFMMILWNYVKGQRLCEVKLNHTVPLSLSFNPSNWRQLCMTSGTFVYLWTVEQCDTIYLFHKRVSKLPPEDLAQGSTYDAAPAELSRVHTAMSHRSTRLEVEVPKTSISGLYGELFADFEEQLDETPRAVGISHAWNVHGDIFIGSQQGHIIKLEVETLKLRVVINPYDQVDRETSRLSLAADDAPNSHSQASKRVNCAPVLCLAINRAGLYAGLGDPDCVLRLLVLNQDNSALTEINDVHRMPASVSSLNFNFTYNRLAVGCTSGRMDILSAGAEVSNKTLLDTQSGEVKSITAVMSHDGTTKYCATVREGGELQIWNAKSGQEEGLLFIGEKATALACSPLAPLLVAGTASGFLCFVDASTPSQMRLVHRVRIHSGAVKRLVFDPRGYCALSIEDGVAVAINGRPSSTFEPLGFTEFPGIIQDVSLRWDDENNRLQLVIVSRTGDTEAATRITFFELPEPAMENPLPFHASPRCDFKAEAVRRMELSFTAPKFGCHLLPGCPAQLMSVGLLERSLEMVVLPEEPPKKAGNKASFLGTVEIFETMTHEDPNCRLISTPSGHLLVSFGRDGYVRFAEGETYELLLPARIHDENVNDAALAPDGSLLFTCGTRSILSTALRGAPRVMRKARDDLLDFLSRFSDLIASESRSLKSRPDWRPPKQESLPSVSREATKDSELTTATTPMPEFTVDHTWLQIKDIENQQAEDEHYIEAKRALRKELKEIKRQIKEMVDVNDSLPELERLDRHEFELDVEEQSRILAETDAVVQKVRENNEFSNLAKEFTHHIIKRECWDKMLVKGRSLCAFNSPMEVSNFPMKERSKETLRELEKVKIRRQLEVIDAKANKEIADAAVLKPTNAAEDVEEVEDEDAKEATSLIGSAGASLGGACELAYSQFDLHTREQKIQQIVLLQDVIYRIEEFFNKEFDETFKRKAQELTKIKDKNVRIRKILYDLDLLESQPVVDPAFNTNEQPEQLLVVQDSEVKVEKYLTPAQRKKLEEEQQLEEERKRKERMDNWRERGLDEMMYGVLEIKKEDELKKDIPKPTFMLIKGEEEWTEEEKKLAAEYERKVKELNEEREKYRKQLESELKKLTTFIDEGKQGFDEQLGALFQKRIRAQMAVMQEQLKIWRIRFNLLVDEELLNREMELRAMTEEKKKKREESAKMSAETRRAVEKFRENYDILSAEDKVLEKNFKKEFSDLPGHQVDQLFKLFKRRPRKGAGAAHLTPAHSTLGDAPLNPYCERPSTSRQAQQQKSALDTALVDMDAERNMPDGIDISVWRRLCKARRDKMEKEVLLKQRALELAEVNAFLQRRQEEEELLKADIAHFENQEAVLREDRRRFETNLQVQLLLKQGQVEVEPAGGFIHDFSDSILVHRSAVEDLNTKIRSLGEAKVQHMVEGKDFKKRFIHLEWELKKMTMEVEDLRNKMKDIQSFKISREVQRYLNAEDYDGLINSEIQKLEQAMGLLKKHHERALFQKDSKLKYISKHTARNIEEKNNALEVELTELNVCLNERIHIDEVNDVKQTESSGAEQRYRAILQRQKLVDLAKAQAKEVAVLRAEVERLRMRTFPALVQNK